MQIHLATGQHTLLSVCHLFVTVPCTALQSEAWVKLAVLSLVSSHNFLWGLTSALLPVCPPGTNIKAESNMKNSQPLLRFDISKNGFLSQHTMNTPWPDTWPVAPCCMNPDSHPVSTGTTLHPLHQKPVLSLRPWLQTCGWCLLNRAVHVKELKIGLTSVDAWLKI